MKNYKQLTSTPFCNTIVADLFEVFEETNGVIAAHQANCFHTMGAGIAAIIRKRYPEAYTADCLSVKDQSKLGSFTYAHVNYGKIVANLYGQGSFSRKSRGDRDTSYDALYDALKALYAAVGTSDTYTTVLLPWQLGSDLAGGKFPIIQAMIELLAEEHEVQTYICRLPSTL